MNHDASVDYTASPPRWMQALSLLDAVNGEGLGPDPPCLSLALSECAKAGRWEVRRSGAKPRDINTDGVHVSCTCHEGSWPVAVLHRAANRWCAFIDDGETGNHEPRSRQLN